MVVSVFHQKGGLGRIEGEVVDGLSMEPMLLGGREVSMLIEREEDRMRLMLFDIEGLVFVPSRESWQEDAAHAMGKRCDW